MDRKLLLLGVLRQQEMHGYQLYDFIERYLAACTDLKKSTAYYLLNQMAEDGWIVEESQQEGNRPPRRVYRLSPQGQEAFQRLLRENLAGHNPAYFVDDIGVAFSEALDPAEALELLALRRKALTAELEAARAAPQHSGNLQWVIEHQQRHLTTELDWLDELIARLESKMQS